MKWKAPSSCDRAPTTITVSPTLVQGSGSGLEHGLAHLRPLARRAPHPLPRRLISMVDGRDERLEGGEA
eukprot:scaffold74456_cov33-Phaeocystis_antarctica.AAC.1